MPCRKAEAGAALPQPKQQAPPSSSKPSGGKPAARDAAADADGGFAFQRIEVDDGRLGFKVGLGTQGATADSAFAPIMCMLDAR